MKFTFNPHKRFYFHFRTLLLRHKSNVCSQVPSMLKGTSSLRWDEGRGRGAERGWRCPRPRYILWSLPHAREQTDRQVTGLRAGTAPEPPALTRLLLTRRCRLGWGRRAAPAPHLVCLRGPCPSPAPPDEGPLPGCLEASFFWPSLCF